MGIVKISNLPPGVESWAGGESGASSHLRHASATLSLAELLAADTESVLVVDDAPTGMLRIYQEWALTYHGDLSGAATVASTGAIGLATTTGVVQVGLVDATGLCDQTVRTQRNMSVSGPTVVQTGINAGLRIYQADITGTDADTDALTVDIWYFEIAGV